MTKPNLTGAQIKLKLQESDTTISDIASVLGCSHSHISNVMHRRSYSIKVAKAICTLIKLPLEQVFGDVESYFSTKPTRDKRRAEIEHKLREYQVLQ